MRWKSSHYSLPEGRLIPHRPGVGPSAPGKPLSWCGGAEKSGARKSALCRWGNRAVLSALLSFRSIGQCGAKQNQLRDRISLPPLNGWSSFLRERTNPLPKSYFEPQLQTKGRANSPHGAIYSNRDPLLRFKPRLGRTHLNGPRRRRPSQPLSIKPESDAQTNPNQPASRFNLRRRASPERRRCSLDPAEE